MNQIRSKRCELGIRVAYFPETLYTRLQTIAKVGGNAYIIATFMTCVGRVIALLDDFQVQ